MTSYNELKVEEEFQQKLDIHINCARKIFARDLDNTFP
jgi:hypothetical protein